MNGRNYRTLGEIDPDLFRDLIAGSKRTQATPEGEAPAGNGIMLPRRTSNEELRRQTESFVEGQPVEDNQAQYILETVAANMGRNADDPERVADAIVSQPSYNTRTMGDPSIDLGEYENLPPLDELLGRDQTRAALGRPDPVNVEGSTRGAVPVSQQEGNTPEPTNYTIQSGDTLGRIASRNNTTVDAILAANPSISDPDKISVDQEIVIPAATETPTDTPTASPIEMSDATSTLLDYISTGEGTYTSYNSGTVNGRIQHYSHDYMHNNTSLSDMTIGQIREQMSITDPTDPNRIYAAGRYQVIPSTLNAAVEALGLSDDTVFDQETQDKIGLYLISEKRPRVGRYIEGDEGVTTERAMLDLAMEFASFPVPYAIRQGTYGSWPKRDIQAGESFYAPADSGPGTNRASHTVAETRSLLESIRGN